MCLAGIFVCGFVVFPLRAISAALSPADSSPVAQAQTGVDKTSGAQNANAGEKPDALHSTTGEAMRWVNFLILIVAGAYFIIKKGGPVFRARAERVAAGITSAAAVKAEADAQLKKAEAGLARLDQDAAAMRTESQKEFAAETEHIRAAGRQEIARIESAAAAEISAARRAAERDLRVLAAQLAAARAAEIVPGQLTDAQRAALVSRFVDELPAAGGTRGVN